MARIIEGPQVVTAAGNKPKRIEEYVGRLASGTAAVSVARMKSSSGWEEPGQTPEFDEYTVVLSGSLQVETRAGASRCGPGRLSSLPRGSGCATARQGPRGQSTWPSACRPSRPAPSTATRRDRLHRRPKQGGRP